MYGKIEEEKNQLEILEWALATVAEIHSLDFLVGRKTTPV